MQVSAIVPACNEAARIGKVLEILKQVSSIREIIVVDDGSFDGTGEVANAHGVTVFRNEERQGKGQALEVGVRKTRGDVLFFCDADIEGLTPRVVDEILAPVIQGDVEMSIGARKSKMRSLAFGYTYSPLLDGQRALTRALWGRVPSVQKKGYRIEVSLNYHARTSIHNVFEISQTTKESKRGPIRGKIERYLMYGEIIFAHILNRLQIE